MKPIIWLPQVLLKRLDFVSEAAERFNNYLLQSKVRRSLNELSELPRSGSDPELTESIDRVWARLFPEVSVPSLNRAQQVGKEREWFFWGLGFSTVMSAAVLSLVILRPAPPHEAGQEIYRLKSVSGVAENASVGLQFALVHSGGRVTQGRDGERVPVGTGIIFRLRVESRQGVRGVLYVRAPEGSKEKLTDVQEFSQGQYFVEDEDGFVSFSLNETGTFEFSWERDSVDDQAKLDSKTSSRFKVDVVDLQ